MYSYYVYGVYVSSEFQLYNLVQTSGHAQIFIRKGKINYDNIPSSQKDFYYSAERVVFSTQTAAYDILNGKEIIVQASNTCSPLEISGTLIGWCFAFLFTQRGSSVIHCTALNIYEHGVLISGISGSGKSTTALQLIKHGHLYLADDMMVINPTLESQFSGYPLQKLCSNCIDHIPANKLLYIDEERDKYAYANDSDYYPNPLKIKFLFILEVWNCEHVECKEITGLNRYLRVLGCLFLAEIYSFKSTPEGDKFRCLQLAGQIKVFVIKRPASLDTTVEVTNLIEQICRKL